MYQNGYKEHMKNKRKQCHGIVFELECVLTAQEAANIYGLSTATVRNAIKRGAIHGRKSAGTWLIRREDADKRWSLGDLSDQ